MDNLGYIDFIVLALLAFFAIRGFFSGFIRELFGMFGLVLGVAFGSRYAYETGAWFKFRVFDFGSETLNTLVGFILVFLAIWVLMLLASELISRLTKTAFSKYLNGLLGFLFGAIKSFLAIAIVLHFAFGLEFMSGVLTHFGNHSKIYPSMETFASKIIKIDIIKHIPKDANEAEQKLNNVKDGIVEKTKELGEKVEGSVKNQEQIIQGQE